MLAQAFEVLSDFEKRSLYDYWLNRSEQPNAQQGASRPFSAKQNSAPAETKDDSDFSLLFRVVFWVLIFIGYLINDQKMNDDYQFKYDQIKIDSILRHHQMSDTSLNFDSIELKPTMEVNQ